ncbi:MAG: TonB-dependent receptor, partial [Terriglobales bacterium]
MFNDMTGSVSGPYLASLLSNELGTTVTAGEAYTSVFPGGAIPQRAWSAPGKNLLQYIPSPNVSASQFSTSAFAQTVRDDKGAARIDVNSHLGEVSGYYFADNYNLDNPYPGSVAGASVPGFDALFIGQAQLISLGDNKVIGSNAVNEFHLGYLRNANVIGQPKGGLGVSLASQGFVTGAGTPGIYVQAPQFEGVQNISFPTFVMGVPITNLTQINNTFYVSDGLFRVIGAHTIKFGGQFHIDQVNEHANATLNGTFNIDGTETGDPYADLLIGVASNFTQSTAAPFYLRNRYFGAYGQDSWRARSDLTVNAGLRWDVIMPFWEKYGETQTYVPGQQSTLYPG